MLRSKTLLMVTYKILLFLPLDVLTVSCFVLPTATLAHRCLYQLPCLLIEVFVTNLTKCRIFRLLVLLAINSFTNYCFYQSLSSYRLAIATLTNGRCYQLSFLRIVVVDFTNHHFPKLILTNCRFNLSSSTNCCF